MTPINIRTALIVCAVAFVITAAIGPSVIRYLRKMKFGQKILEIGPKWHMNKQNIPTMGGFMFIIGIAAAVLAGNLLLGHFVTRSVAVLGLAAAYGAVGLVDDYAKIKKKENAGLSPKQKLVLQIWSRRYSFWCCSSSRTACRISGSRSPYCDPAALAAVHHFCSVCHCRRG